VGFVDGEY